MSGSKSEGPGTKADLLSQVDGRHPSTQHIVGYFAYSHLPPHLQAFSKPLGEVARSMTEHLPDGPELTAGLRKLLEAKDCFVRAALDKED